MTKNKLLDMESEIRILREWVKANSRRIEELENTTFQLDDMEEVLIVAAPKRRKGGTIV